MMNYLGRSSLAVNPNTPKAIRAMIMLSVIGTSMFIIQPGYVQGLVDYSGFSGDQAGYIASSEMFGIAVMAVFINFVIHRINWRILSLAFLLTSMLGNMFSIGSTDIDWLLPVRFITGLGAGGLIAVTFSMLGLTQNPDRNIGLLVATLLTYGAIGLWVMPTVFQWGGVEVLMAALAVFYALGFCFVGQVPCSNQREARCAQVESDAFIFSWSVKSASLLGMLSYSLAIGLVWIYILLVGIDAGIEEQAAANILTVSQFVGIAGALMPAIFQLRFGRLAPLMLGILGGAAGIGLLLGQPTLVLFAAGVCVFNFLWNLTIPYLMSNMASLDDSGQVIVIAVSVQMVGYAIGPFWAAQLLGQGGYDLINTVGIGLFVLSAALLVPGLSGKPNLLEAYDAKV